MLTLQDINKILGRIWFVKSRDIFRRALRRGVSYHHRGLGNKKRSCVEMLFRKKCLQVTFEVFERFGQVGSRLLFVLNSGLQDSVARSNSPITRSQYKSFKKWQWCERNAITLWKEMAQG